MKRLVEPEPDDPKEPGSDELTDSEDPAKQAYSNSRLTLASHSP
jgi:hypothetical protein